MSASGGCRPGVGVLFRSPPLASRTIACRGGRRSGDAEMSSTVMRVKCDVVRQLRRARLSLLSLSLYAYLYIHTSEGSE